MLEAPALGAAGRHLARWREGVRDAERLLHAAPERERGGDRLRVREADAAKYFKLYVRNTAKDVDLQVLGERLAPGTGAYRYVTTSA